MKWLLPFICSLASAATLTIHRHNDPAAEGGTGSVPKVAIHTTDVLTVPILLNVERGGTATLIADYQLHWISVLVSGLHWSHPILLPIIDDGTVDAAETITFDLKNTVSWDFSSTTPTFDDTTETFDDANDGGWVLGDSISVTITITDND